MPDETTANAGPRAAPVRLRLYQCEICGRDAVVAESSDGSRRVPRTALNPRCRIYFSVEELYADGWRAIAVREKIDGAHLHYACGSSPRCQDKHWRRQAANELGREPYHGNDRWWLEHSSRASDGDGD